MNKRQIGVNLDWIALAAAALILLIGVAYGFQYVAGQEGLIRYFRLFTVPFAAVTGVLTWFTIRGGPAVVGDPRASFHVGFALMAFSFFLTCYLNSRFLGPYPWWLLAFGVPALGYFAYKKLGPRGSNITFVVGFLTLSGYLIAHLPNESGGDMLQIIEFASRDFVAGSSPYRPYLTVSGKEVPFAYWPGVWLPYSPFVALGLDMRLLNLVAAVGLLLLFEKATKDSGHASLIAALTVYPFVLSPSVMKMMIIGHLWLYWLAGTAAALLLARGRLLAAAILLGFCLASRPTALFIIVPLAAYIWSRYGLRRTLGLGAVTLGVTLAFNLPFALAYGQAFWENSYGVLGGVSQKLVHFSLAGYFKDAGMDFMNKPIQMGIMVASMAVVVFAKKLPVQRIVMLAGLTYVWMILLNSYATRYVYFEGFLVLEMGLALLLAQAYVDRDKERIAENTLASVEGGQFASVETRENWS